MMLPLIAFQTETRANHPSALNPPANKPKFSATIAAGRLTTGISKKGLRRQAVVNRCIRFDDDLLPCVKPCLSCGTGLP
jgi:hypothetical protein